MPRGLANACEKASDHGGCSLSGLSRDNAAPAGDRSPSVAPAGRPQETKGHSTTALLDRLCSPASTVSPSMSRTTSRVSTALSPTRGLGPGRLRTRRHPSSWSQAVRCGIESQAPVPVSRSAGRRDGRHGDGSWFGRAAPQWQDGTLACWAARPHQRENEGYRGRRHPPAHATARQAQRSSPGTDRARESQVELPEQT